MERSFIIYDILTGPPPPALFISRFGELLNAYLHKLKGVAWRERSVVKCVNQFDYLVSTFLFVVFFSPVFIRLG